MYFFNHTLKTNLILTFSQKSSSKIKGLILSHYWFILRDENVKDLYIVFTCHFGNGDKVKIKVKISKHEMSNASRIKFRTHYTL